MVLTCAHCPDPCIGVVLIAGTLLTPRARTSLPAHARASTGCFWLVVQGNWPVAKAHEVREEVTHVLQTATQAHKPLLKISCPPINRMLLRVQPKALQHVPMGFSADGLQGLAALHVTQNGDAWEELTPLLPACRNLRSIALAGGEHMWDSVAPQLTQVTALHGLNELPSAIPPRVQSLDIPWACEWNLVSGCGLWGHSWDLPPCILPPC